MYSVYKVLVKNAAGGTKTVTSNPSGGSYSSADQRKYGYGELFSWAACHYYFNQQTAAADKLGTHRRYSYALRLQLPYITFACNVGDEMVNIPGNPGSYYVDNVSRKFDDGITVIEVSRPYA